jgi:hypothetical protein
MRSDYSVDVVVITDSGYEDLGGMDLRQYFYRGVTRDEAVARAIEQASSEGRVVSVTTNVV